MLSFQLAGDLTQSEGSTHTGPDFGSSQFERGTHVGPYEILAPLGAGGMGDVYEAEDARLGRRVAIKFLRVEMADDAAAIARFHREARAASALDHPHICTVHDVGQLETTGQQFIVMEKLEGRTLKTEIALGPLDERKVLRLGAQVADALEAAHAKKIVHRDLTSANVFVTPRGDAKVLDFGLATLPGTARPVSGTHETAALSDDVRLTGEGLAIGTVAYMSPEQVRGEALDARTDLFSLGIVLYEMVTRTLPFKGNTPGAIFDAILNRVPVAPARLNPEVSPQLEGVINRALEKDRALRYQTARDLRADLLRVDQSICPSLSGDRSAYRGWRGPRWLGVSAAVLLAVGAGLSSYARRGPVLTDRDTILIADFVNTTGEAIFDDTLKQALAIKLEESPFLNVFAQERIPDAMRLMGRRSDERLEPGVARELCQRQNLKAMVAGSIAPLGTEYVVTLNGVDCASGNSVARVQSEARNRESVLRALGQSASVLRAKLGESLASIRKFDVPLEEATTSSLQALRAFTLAGAQRGENAVIPLARQAIDLDPNFAMAYMRLAMAYRNAGAVSLAAEQTERAFQLRQRTSERERLVITAYYAARVSGDLGAEMDAWKLLQETYPRLASPFNNLANTYRLHFDDLGRAIEGYQRAIDVDPSSNVATPYYNLTNAYLEIGRLDNASRTAAQAIVRKQVYWALPATQFRIAFIAGDPAAMKTALRNLAETEPGRALSPEIVVAQYYGRAREAEVLNDKGIELRTGPMSKELNGMALLDLAEFDAAVGRTFEAVARTAAAVRIFDERGALARAARVDASVGRLARAQALLDQVERLYPPNDTIAQAVLLPSVRAQMALARGNAGAAVEILKTASSYRGLMHHDVAYLRANVLLAAGRPAEALNEFKWLAGKAPTFEGGFFGVKGHLYSLSRLGVARAAAQTGDIEGSRRAYEDFLALWKDADSDVPILIAANREYARLVASDGS